MASLGKINLFYEWENVRDRGIYEFVLLYGVVGFGLVTSIAVLAYNANFSGHTLTATYVVNVLFSFMIIGIFWAMFVWWINEKRYQKLKKLTQSGDVNA